MSINHKKLISGRSSTHNIVRHGVHIDSKLTNDGKSILQLTNNPNSSLGIGSDIDNIFSKISLLILFGIPYISPMLSALLF